jgi:hypothetical protein
VRYEIERVVVGQTENGLGLFLNELENRFLDTQSIAEGSMEINFMFSYIGQDGTIRAAIKTYPSLIGVEELSSGTCRGRFG